MSFKLKEHYGIDDKGGFIKYKLYKLIGRGDGATWLEADLSELEETKDLKGISFNGIFEKFSIYKPNN